MEIDGREVTQLSIDLSNAQNNIVNLKYKDGELEKELAKIDLSNLE